MAPTRLPAPEDWKMWRRVLARLHPDHGGDGELFQGAQAVRARVGAEPAGERCAPCSEVFTVT